MNRIRARRRWLALAVAMSAVTLCAEVPGAWAQEGLTRLPSVNLGASAHDIVLDGNRAYVATDTGLTVLDISEREFPQPIGSAATVGSGKSQGIAVAGGYAYLATQSAGLQVFRLSSNGEPTWVAARKVVGAAWDVAVKDNIAYVVSFGGEMHLFDISNPEAPQKLRTVIGLPAWRSPAGDATNLAKLNNGVTSGNAKATGVSVAGNHLFAVDWNYGRLYYYDVSDAANPRFAGTHEAPYILRVEADPANDVVYMLSAFGSGSGIYTVPISMLHPNLATRHSTCALCSFAKSKAVIDQGGLGIAPGGRHMFYAGGKIGEFHILRVTHHPAAQPGVPPVAPPDLLDVATTTIGPHRVPMPQAMGLQAIGDYLYFAAGATGLQVFKYPGLSD